MKPNNRRVVLRVVAIVCLAVVAGDAQELCSTTMAIPGSRSNIIFIENVSETTPPNTVLKKLEIFGSDSQITLHMMTVNDNIRFNESTRELIVNKSFNITDGTPSYININITCTAPGISTLFQIVIQVYDMNNNPPWFTNIPYSVNISERTSLNSTIFNGVEAVDVDPSDKGYLIYSVDDRSTFSSYFSFPVSSIGNLVLMKRLDYETIPRFNLTITVKDNGNNLTILGQRQPQHTATTSILINVLPADDYNPTFNQSTYTGILTIDTQTQPNRCSISLQPISATIKHAKLDESLIYSMVLDEYNADASYFVIDNQTGVISPRPSTAQISSNDAAFQIQATKVNQSYRYGRALVKLDILRTTEPLKFTQDVYVTSLADATTNGTLVATVVAVKGRSNPFYYFNTDVRDFTIDSNSGEIRTTTTINYKTSSLYNLSVTANDSKYIDVCRVIVNLTLQNRYNPHLAKTIYTFSISEGTSFVGQIVATSDDPASSLSYRLIDTSSYFDIDNTGRLFCKCSSANYFSNSTLVNTHSMMLIVEDGIEPARQASALVVVTWNTTGLPVPPVRSTLCEGADEEATGAYYIAVIVLGVAAGLFLIIIFILVLCLCRRGRTNSDPRPRVTIEVNRTPQKSQNSGSQGSRKSGNVLEAAKEYGPYFAYGLGNLSDDVITHSPSTLNSSDRLQKLKLYQSAPTPRFEKTPNPNGVHEEDPNSRLTNSQVSNVSRKPPQQQQHHRLPPYSSSSIDTSSPPSSRVERYRFEDDVSPEVSPRYTKSVARSPPMSSSIQGPGTRLDSVSGPRRDSRLESTMLALVESFSDDTSSTETLVTSVESRAKPSNVSFVDNTGGYFSSQEGIDVSMSALHGTDGDPAITVYY